MRQIFQNRFLRSYQFSNAVEQTAFIQRVSATRVLSIEESDGQNPICCVGRNSLTHEAEFVLSFRSDSSEEYLNFLFWDGTMVLDTGKTVYLIDEKLSIIASLDITTPLIGLYLVTKEKLLLLEEAYLRVIDHDGHVLKSEIFDLIEEFSVDDGVLAVKTNEESRSINLN
jgi:hypothetical protein